MPRCEELSVTVGFPNSHKVSGSALKRCAGDTRHTCRDVDRSEAGTACEDLATEFSHAVGQLHIPECAARQRLILEFF